MLLRSFGYKDVRFHINRKRKEKHNGHGFQDDHRKKSRFRSIRRRDRNHELAKTCPGGALQFLLLALPFSRFLASDSPSSRPEQ